MRGQRDMVLEAVDYWRQAHQSRERELFAALVQVEALRLLRTDDDGPIVALRLPDERALAVVAEVRRTLAQLVGHQRAGILLGGPVNLCRDRLQKVIDEYDEVTR